MIKLKKKKDAWNKTSMSYLRSRQVKEKGSGLLSLKSTGKNKVLDRILPFLNKMYYWITKWGQISLYRGISTNKWRRNMVIIIFTLQFLVK